MFCGGLKYLLIVRDEEGFVIIEEIKKTLRTQNEKKKEEQIIFIVTWHFSKNLLTKDFQTMCSSGWGQQQVFTSDISGSHSPVQQQAGG